MTPFWVSVFLDLAAADHERGVGFWAAVTGYAASPPRGDSAEHLTLVPPAGDDFLRVQRLGDGPSRIHLDLHVTDPAVAADEAVSLGARLVQRSPHGYVVLTSPGGLTFCFVSHPAGTRPPPAAWPGGHTSIVDQVCLDIAPSRYEEECAFWGELTGWEASASAVSPDFRRLERPAGQPFRMLLQRLGDERPTSAHLDLAASDVAAEVARHVALGARVVGTHPVWTVLEDPAGSAYCITGRSPETGLLP